MTISRRLRNVMIGAAVVASAMAVVAGPMSAGGISGGGKSSVSVVAGISGGGYSAAHSDGVGGTGDA